jgi:Family of unknown function (DUF6082)
MVIAIISTLISSIALVGVAASLLLQARQLRASQVQASRVAQIELIKMAIDNRELISDIFGDEPGSYLKARYVNWFFKYLELGYSMKIISEKSVQVQAMMLFDTDYPYKWWIRAREVWEIEASTKRDRNFFKIVDNAFQRTAEQRQAGGSSGSQATPA